MAVADLETEVTTLLSCTYPASLKKLEQVLLDCTAADVQVWAICHPCRITPLASLVLQSNGVCDCTENIIARLCLSRSLQEAFLTTDGQLLDRLLHDARTKHETQQDTAAIEGACIALLSHPLPEGIALPDAVRQFLITLVERAISSSNAASLRPIYSVLKADAQQLTDILPIKTLASFVERIFQILRSTTSFEDEPLYLLCLSIVRLLARIPPHQHDDDQHAVTDQVKPIRATQNGSKQRLNSARAYFVGPKALKTLQLVALEVMWAYKSESLQRTEAILDSLEMATPLVNTMDQAVRAEWSRANAAVVRKIMEKAGKGDLLAEAQLAGTIFLNSITADDSSFAMWASGGEKAGLLAALGAEAGGDSLRIAIEDYMVNLGDKFDSHITVALLTHVLDVALAESQPSMFGIQRASWVLRSMTEQAARRAAFRSAILAALSPNESHGLRLRLLRVIERMEGRDTTTRLSHATDCDITQLSALEELTNALKQLVVGIALLEPQHTLCISGTDLWRLVRASKLASSAPPTCEHSVWQPPRPVSKPVPPQDVNCSGQSWPERLRYALDKDTDSRHASIVHLVTEACQDLQARCDNVEEPLRHERARLEALNTQHSALQQRYDDALMLLDARGHDLETQTERCRALTESLSEAEATSTSRSVRVEELERSLTDTQSIAATNLQQLREKYEGQILLHRGEKATMQEDLEDLQDAIKLKANDLNEAKAKLSESEASRAAEQTKVESLTEELAQRNIELRDLHEELKLRSAAAANEQQALVEKHSDAIERMIKAEQEAKDASTAAIEQLRSDLNIERLEHDKTTHRLRTAEEQQEQDLALADQLKADLKETRTAFAEAQEMRSRLIQAMGLPVSSTLPQPSERRRSRQTAIGNELDHAVTSGATTVVQKSVGSTPSSSGTPTPKRVKPRVKPLVPATHRLQHSKVRLPSTRRESLGTRKRQPLQNTSDMGNAVAAKAIPSSRNGKALSANRSALSELSLESRDLDFDADELLSGTPAMTETRIDDLEGYELFDETTADF